MPDTYTLTISDLSVITTIGNLAVTEGKIGPLAVTEGKIGNLAVTAGKIGSSAVTEGKIGSLAVTEGKIGSLAVTEGKIANLAVTGDKIANLTISGGKLQADSITNVKVASNAAIALSKLGTGELPSTITVPLSASSTTSGLAALATSLSGGSAGRLAYQTNAGITAFVSAGNSGQVLTSAGTGTPTWVTTVPASAGGTGISSYSSGNLLYANSASSLAQLAPPIQDCVLKISSSSNVPSWIPLTGSGNAVLSTSPNLTTPILGVPTSGTLTNCTGLPLSTGVTGSLPEGRGGTGVTSSTGSGNNVLSNTPTLVTPILGTPASGTLTNCTGLPLTGVGIVAGTFDWTTANGLSHVVTGVTGLLSTSKVFVQQKGASVTARHYSVVPNTGSFTIYANANTTGDTFYYLAIL